MQQQTSNNNSEVLAIATVRFLIEIPVSIPRTRDKRHVKGRELGRHLIQSQMEWEKLAETNKVEESAQEK